MNYEKNEISIGLKVKQCDLKVIQQTCTPVSYTRQTNVISLRPK